MTTTLQNCLTVQQVVLAWMVRGIVSLEIVTMIFVSHIHLDTLKHSTILHTMFMDNVNMC